MNAGIEGMTMTRTLVEEGGQAVLSRKIGADEGILIKPIQNQFDRWNEL